MDMHDHRLQLAATAAQITKKRVEKIRRQQEQARTRFVNLLNFFIYFFLLHL